jgi:hypothetical protein
VVLFASKVGFGPGFVVGTREEWGRVRRREERAVFYARFMASRPH